MKYEMLQIAQYLYIHPVLKRDKGLRRNYVILINYFVKKHGAGTLWSKQLLKLYGNKIVENGFKVDNVIAKDLSLFEKFKFFKYRYYLLTDCLFIRFFCDKKGGRKIVDDVIEFYGRRYQNKLERIYDAFYSMGDDGFIRDFSNMKEIYAIIWQNRSFMKRPLKKIMITANMSAGKSTLLNALAGKKVNKTQNETCTAKIHYIFNKSGEDGLNYELDHKLELDASLADLMTDNEDNDSTDIVVGTRFRSLKEIEKRICFIDTPGVNASMYKEHRKLTESTISSIKCDTLIYLFNAENIGTDDEKEHLLYVKNNYSGRIIFLINRLDHFKNNESVLETIEREKNDLIEMGFDAPEIYPISAYAAYLAKTVLIGEHLPYEEEEELHDLMRKLKKDNFCYQKYYPVDTSSSSADGIEGLLLHSGIISLESILYM